MGMSGLMFLLFSVALLGATAVAVAGRRGQVSERKIGGDVPAVVQRDPQLLAQVDRMVATWGTAAAVMCVPPLLALAWYGLDRAVPLPALVAVAVYGFVLACVGHYPFERIKEIARRERDDAAT